METLTGVLTGSDCSPFRKLNKDLLEMGLKAEGIFDDRVWMVKSHHPERAGSDMLDAHKCVLVVRNPLDAIMSLFHMVATGTHNCSVHPDDFDAWYPLFEKFVKQEIVIWKEFHSYWCDGGVPIPTYIVRYEDLVKNKKQTLKQIFCFLLNVESLENTLISEIIEQHSGDAQIYKP